MVGNRRTHGYPKGGALRAFFSDWRNTLPIAGLGALAVTGLYYFLRPKPVDPAALERERRAYLNRVGRIVEGCVVEVVDGSAGQPPGPRSADDSPVPVGQSAPLSVKASVRSRTKRHEALVANRHGNGTASATAALKLLY